MTETLVADGDDERSFYELLAHGGVNGIKTEAMVREDMDTFKVADGIHAHQTADGNWGILLILRDDFVQPLAEAMAHVFHHDCDVAWQAIVGPLLWDVMRPLLAEGVQQMWARGVPSTSMEEMLANLGWDDDWEE